MKECLKCGTPHMPYGENESNCVFCGAELRETNGIGLSHRNYLAIMRVYKSFIPREVRVQSANA